MGGAAPPGVSPLVSARGDGLGFPQVRKEVHSVEWLLGNVVGLSTTSVQPRVCVKRKNPPELSLCLRQGEDPLLIPVTLSPIQAAILVPIS